ncbi:hypothetical protein FACS1894179_03490 [Bacteroidia bacterium]|nr:hypothetical protein FACS1894179_03490 [Bacteroidia bacterium]
MSINKPRILSQSAYYRYNDLLLTVANNNDSLEINNRFRIFAEELVWYCRNEQKVFSTYRILNEMKTDIAIRNRMYDLTVCDLFERICSFINGEIELAQAKIKNPLWIESDKDILSSKTPSLLLWISDKINLVELIYAIAHSVNNGNASIEEIKNCFEFIFQVNLGNIYDRVDELKTRVNTAKYINALPEQLVKNIFSAKKR